MIDLAPHELDMVRSILQRHIPGKQVRVFGSRVTGKAKPFSDIDLVIMGAEPLSTKVLADLSNDFTESALRYKVDIVDWATTGENFRRIIDSHAVSIL